MAKISENGGAKTNVWDLAVNTNYVSQSFNQSKIKLEPADMIKSYNFTLFPTWIV